MSDAPTRERWHSTLESFAHDVVVAIVNTELHDAGSDHVRTATESIVDGLRDLVALGCDTPVRFEFQGARVCVAGEPLLGASLQARRLLRLAAERGVVALEFLPRLAAAELGRFLTFFRFNSDRQAFLCGDHEHALARLGVIHVRVVTEADALRESPPRSDDRSNARGDAIERYQALADVLQGNHVAAFHGEDLELDGTSGVVERAMAQMDARPSELLALANYDDIDRFTVGHSVRVGLLALEVARALGASKDVLMLVGTAGLLHDVGKSRIPQEILFKRGRLDDDEWRLMAEHPRLGAEILVEQRDVHPSAIGAAFCHHMAPGARGYPDPLLPFDPSGISKLVRVCDVFEALTAIRPYKRALSPLEAHVIMHRHEGDFDPAWLHFFFQTIGIYPLGTRLRLDTGELAQVEDHGPSFLKPVVRILENATGSPPADDAPTVVTIGDVVDGLERRILEVVSRHGTPVAHDDGVSLERIVAAQPHVCFDPTSCGHSHHRS